MAAGHPSPFGSGGISLPRPISEWRRDERKNAENLSSGFSSFATMSVQMERVNEAPPPAPPPCHFASMLTFASMTPLPRLSPENMNPGVTSDI